MQEVDIDFIHKAGFEQVKKFFYLFEKYLKIIPALKILENHSWHICPVKQKFRA